MDAGLLTAQQRRLSVAGQWLVLAGGLAITAATVSRLMTLTWAEGFEAGQKAAALRDRVLEEEPHG